jgi:hypothetical protein
MAKAKLRTDKEQAKAFRKAARELGADDSQERFQDALRTIAKQRLKPTARRTKSHQS